jgi:hypothetical protein
MSVNLPDVDTFKCVNLLYSAYKSKGSSFEIAAEPSEQSETSFLMWRYLDGIDAAPVSFMAKSLKLIEWRKRARKEKVTGRRG